MPRPPRHRRRAAGARPAPLAAALAALLPALACRTPAEHAAAADEEVYGLLADRRAALGFEAPYSVDPVPGSLRERLLSGEAETPLPPLSLLDALRIAAESSREFQERREALYRTALDLTLARWQFDPHESAALRAQLSGAGKEAQVAAVGALAGVSKLFSSGTLVVGDLAVDLVKGLVSGDPWEAVSAASLTVTQPLLRGFGDEIVREPLTQAERDVLYEIRSFERFRRTLAFEVTQRYTRILQQMDVLANEIANRTSLVVLRERNEALGEAGRLSDIQVDQARQEELQAQNAVVEAERELQALLDEFKLFLGLPLEVEIAVEPSELERLFAMELPPLELDEDRAAAVALALRLDHQNALGRVEDATRRIRVAADDLEPGLDLVLSASAVSEAGDPVDFHGEDAPWTAGIVLDLPLDRLPERNAYREALLDLQESTRELGLSTDEVRADVREALRELDAARARLEIQEVAVELAERRVEITALNLEAGRAETRDVLEAQEDLVAARNALTGARIDLTLAQLALVRDMELLRVDGEGLSFEAPPPLPEDAPGPAAGEARP